MWANTRPDTATFFATGRENKEDGAAARGGAWRPATQADRVQTFAWFTFCWYFGALVVFGLVWRVAQVMYDVAFGDERYE